MTTSTYNPVGSLLPLLTWGNNSAKQDNKSTNTIHHISHDTGAQSHDSSKPRSKQDTTTATL
ncbi:MAG: hypothetical protein V1726_07605 [Methanobacteriota archaeon]